jgi:hypothetical protein
MVRVRVEFSGVLTYAEDLSLMALFGRHASKTEEAGRQNSSHEAVPRVKEADLAPRIQPCYLPKRLSEHLRRLREMRRWEVSELSKRSGVPANRHPPAESAGRGVWLTNTRRLIGWWVDVFELSAFSLFRRSRPLG